MDKVKIKQLLIGLAILLALIVVSQNSAMITMSFLFWNFKLSQLFLFPLLMLVGFGMGYFLGCRNKGY